MVTKDESKRSKDWHERDSMLTLAQCLERYNYPYKQLYSTAEQRFQPSDRAERAMRET